MERQEPYSAGKNEMRLHPASATNKPLDDSLRTKSFSATHAAPPIIQHWKSWNNLPFISTDIQTSKMRHVTYMKPIFLVGELNVCCITLICVSPELNRVHVRPCGTQMGESE